MKVSNLVLFGHQVRTLAFTGLAALLVAGAIGCSSDSRVPESSPAPAADPATATGADIGNDATGAGGGEKAPE